MQKIWLKSYPAGVPEVIDLNAYPSLNALLLASCERHADKTAWCSLGQTLTYAQWLTKSLALAGYLRDELNLPAGSKVALMLPNCLQYPIALLATLLAGLVVVNVNPLYTAHELQHQLDDSQAQVVIVLANMLEQLTDALATLQIKHVIVTRLGDELSWPKSWLLNSYLKWVKGAIPKLSIKNAIAWPAACRQGARHNFKPFAAKQDDLAFLQYTGGTTGVAKGAELTQGNILANVLQIKTWLEGAFKEVSQITIMTPLPLYHVFSLTANCFTFAALGASNVLIIDPRNLASIVKAFKQYRITVITGVNTLYNGLLHYVPFRQLDFSPLKFAVAGGMATQATVAKTWQQVVGKPILEGYGLTESSPVVSFNRPQLTSFNGSIGLPLPSTEVSIRDDATTELALGETGELWVRGPQVMRGYWQRPEATREVIDESGWLATGDVAKIDEDGYIYIVDRKKDMILVSGFNVYPNEVEAVISACPGVQETAVIGVPCDSTGEKIKAFIIACDQTLTEQQVKDYCYQHLTRYKVPKDIVFRDELPKSNVGKILRRALREL